MRFATRMLASGALVFFIFQVGFAGDARSATRYIPEKFALVRVVMQDKCMACHTKNYNLPFYALIPGIKQIIEKDYRDGLRAMNLSDEFDLAKTLPSKVSEVTLAKMEWVALNGTMPPPKFAMVHWRSRMTDGERKALVDWARSVRARYYVNGDADGKMKLANEPLQPIPDHIPVNEAKARLGQKFYRDKRLSGDNTVACIACHELEKAGTDNLRFSKGIGEQLGDANSPTVFNAFFNIRQFWDGRAADLQEQAGIPPFNPVEMGSANWAQIIAKLSVDEPLASEFKTVYPDGWSAKNITEAIAEYEKTLLTPNSRFDQWLLGKKSALNKEEAEGYRRFKAYRCATCHVGKSVGGQSFEYADLKGNYFAERVGPPLKSDIGLKGFSQKEEDLHKFKVPALRNVELTWPYFHDGTVETLEDAVILMGRYLSGLEVPEIDRKLIVAFLRTLTGEFCGKKLEGKAVEK